MKYKIFALFLCGMISISVVGQQSTTTEVYPQNPNAAYQLVPTTNFYNFLKIDTRDGRIWVVQYSTDNNRIVSPLTTTSKVLKEEDKIVGRFYLYPTKNMYTFIMLDQVDGRTWQVQWSTKTNEMGIWPIF